MMKRYRVKHDGDCYFIDVSRTYGVNGGQNIIVRKVAPWTPKYKVGNDAPKLTWINPNQNVAKLYRKRDGTLRARTAKQEKYRGGEKRAVEVPDEVWFDLVRRTLE